MPKEDILPEKNNKDKKLDSTLRPISWDKFIGQEKVKQNLKILIYAAKKRKEPIEHVLLYGCPGLGKTTLAHIIAREIGVNIRVTSGPAIERPGDLGSILTNLKEGSILFIDEIHRLSKVIEEVLYPALEENAFDIIIGKGPSARTLRLDLPKFTLVGATTRIGKITAPLRDRFGMIYKLNFYTEEELAQIIENSAQILNINLDRESTKLISQRSRRTPRIANRILKRVRDFAEVKNSPGITCNLTKKAFKLLEIDELGLDETDHRLLETLIEKFSGGPVGVKTLAAATSEEIETIEDVYEPYLMQIGFLQRTPRGRMATHLAYKHLGIKFTKSNKNEKLPI